jgi:hypothetical protein
LRGWGRIGAGIEPPPIRPTLRAGKMRIFEKDEGPGRRGASAAMNPAAAEDAVPSGA